MSRLLCVLCILCLLAAPALGDPIQVNALDEMPQTEGFLAEGEDPVYYKDHAGGYWLYVSDSVRV